MRDNTRGGALTEVSFYILLALHRPRHGYAVMQFVEAVTDGRLLLGAGTLYGALNAMTAKGWIAPAEQEMGRQKCYCITEAGRAVAKNELTRLRKLVATASDIMGEQV